MPQPYVESASGTTNPDNGNSGPAAYVIAAVAAAVLLLSLGTLASCAKEVLATAVETYGDEVLNEFTDDGFGFEDDYDDLTDEELEKQFKEYLENRESGGSEVDTSEPELSLSEALAQNLALYGDTIDDGVSASDYAGVDDDTRSFVRSLANLDSEAASTVVRHLRAAARAEGEETLAEVELALDTADQTAESLAALDVPEGMSDAQAELLAGAREAAAKRWVAISNLLELLDVEGDVSSQDLADADAAVIKATSGASEAADEALLGSAAADEGEP